jgi:glycosyltransferase involved in cell wall biosynthesis
LPLVWYGHLLEASGYADEARAFLLALERSGYAVAARQAGAASPAVELPAAQRRALRRALARPLPGGAHVAVFHAPPRTGQPLVPGAANVARTMFETESIPQAWLPRLLAVDEVWVPCRFNLETFARGGVPGERLRLLPETLDLDLFDPEGTRPLSIPGRRGRAFLANFEVSDRKGWDVLLRAWAEAFHPHDDVCLVLKCLPRPGLGEEELRARIERLLGGRPTAPILLLAGMLSAEELPRLYAACDAYVLPSRGEAWGRPYMEAMAMGLPTIASRYGGNLEFMHDGNAWLVEGTTAPVPEGAEVSSWYRGQRWFEPDRESLVAALREVAAGGPAVEARASRGRAELRDRFGPEAVSERLRHLVDDLLRRWRERQARPTLCVWRGAWGESHSLAVVNSGLAAALEARGLAVERLAVESPPVPLAVPAVTSSYPPRFEPASAGPLVLYQPWEYGDLPASWAEEIRRRVDEVWTPSEYSRRAFVRAGIAPELVRVVPNGVDLDRFSPQGPRLSLPTDKKTIFLFVGGAIYRKGIDLLLSAFARAFSRRDDVALVVKAGFADGVYRGQTADEMLARFRALADAPELVVIEGHLSAAQLPALYRAADVLVQPSRGEGFCLPVLEALACGLPVIVTAGGATDAFVNDACAWRVPARPAPLPPNELVLSGPGMVLEPDLGALVSALRQAADPASRRAKAACARAQAEGWSWSAAADLAEARLRALARATPVRRIEPAAPARRRGLLFCAHVGEGRGWEEALAAYASAFPAQADTTLALTVVGGEAAARVEEALRRLGVDPAGLADVALVQACAEERTALELACDAAIDTGPPRPLRARRLVPPDPAALRAVAAAGEGERKGARWASARQP